MGDVLGLVVFAVVTVGLIYLFARSYRNAAPEARAGRAMDELEPVSVAAAPAGERVRIRGRLERAGGATVTTRVGGRSGVVTWMAMSHRKSGDTPRWCRESRSVDFRLTDDTGSVDVRASEGAEVLTDLPDECYRIDGPDMPEWMRPMWERRGLIIQGQPGGTSEFEVFEVVLDEGHEIEVMGVLQGGVLVGDPEHGVVVRTLG